MLGCWSPIRLQHSAWPALKRISAGRTKSAGMMLVRETRNAPLSGNRRGECASLPLVFPIGFRVGVGRDLEDEQYPAARACLHVGPSFQCHRRDRWRLGRNCRRIGCAGVYKRQHGRSDYLKHPLQRHRCCSRLRASISIADLRLSLGLVPASISRPGEARQIRPDLPKLGGAQ